MAFSRTLFINRPIPPPVIAQKLPWHSLKFWALRTTLGTMGSYWPSILTFASIYQLITPWEMTCLNAVRAPPIGLSKYRRTTFECDMQESKEHIHWLSTKIIKLDENPSWGATDFHRVHDLRDLTELIHSITSSPNVVTKRGQPGSNEVDKEGNIPEGGWPGTKMPYDESRIFQIYSDIPAIYIPGCG